MIFRPTLWATVATAIVLAVLLGLGTWQLDRREWKQQVLEMRAQRITAPTLALADIGDDGEPDLFEYRPIRLTGRFDGSRSLKLLSRTRAGRVGYHVVTPLAADGGVTVMVDRGWVPVEGKVDVLAAPPGLVSVEGYVRAFETPGPFTPDNNLETGDWFYFDRVEMAAAAGLDTVAPFYVQQAPGAAPPGLYPAGDVPNIALRNSHLQYALTWYALAVALLVIYVVFHVKRRDGEDE